MIISRVMLGLCIAVTFFAGGILSYAALPIPIPRSPLEAKPGDLHAFFGQVKAVDHSARTVTIALGTRFTFKVPTTTQIMVHRGGAASFDAIQPGVGVTIVALRGKNSWTAQKITLERGVIFSEEPSVVTTQGKTITGPAIADYVVSEPPAEVVNRNLDFGRPSGLFLLAIRPDGTVASVRAIKSMGVKELDERATQRLMKARFRPGALKEARVPVNVNSFRRY